MVDYDSIRIAGSVRRCRSMDLSGIGPGPWMSQSLLEDNSSFCEASWSLCPLPYPLLLLLESRSPWYDGSLSTVFMPRKHVSAVVPGESHCAVRTYLGTNCHCARPSGTPCTHLPRAVSLPSSARAASRKPRRRARSSMPVPANKQINTTTMCMLRVCTCSPTEDKMMLLPAKSVCDNQVNK